VFNGQEEKRDLMGKENEEQGEAGRGKPRHPPFGGVGRSRSSESKQFQFFNKPLKKRRGTKEPEYPYP